MQNDAICTTSQCVQNFRSGGKPWVRINVWVPQLFTKPIQKLALFNLNDTGVGLDLVEVCRCSLSYLFPLLSLKSIKKFT